MDSKEATHIIVSKATDARVVNIDKREMEFGKVLSAGMVLVRRVAELETDIAAEVEQSDENFREATAAKARVAELEARIQQDAERLESERKSTEQARARVDDLRRIIAKVDDECVNLRQFREDHEDDETGAQRVNELSDRVTVLEAALVERAIPSRRYGFKLLAIVEIESDGDGRWDGRLDGAPFDDSTAFGWMPHPETRSGRAFHGLPDQRDGVDGG